MNITKEKLLRIINEEIESVKEIEFQGEAMHHQGQEFKTGLGSENTQQDYIEAEQTIEEKVSDMIMIELEKEVVELSGGAMSSAEMGQVDDDLLAIAMRIRDKIMVEIGSSIETEIASAKNQIRKLAGMID